MVPHGASRKRANRRSATSPVAAARPRIIRPCSSRSTSATRTSRSACSGPARCWPRAAPRPTRGRPPTSSRSPSTGSSASTDSGWPTSTPSRSHRSCPPSPPRSSRSPARRERPLVVAGPGTVPLAIRVDRPGDVGADRLVNALAAGRLYGTPAVVVDFGTATTFDCVAADGAYVGRRDRPGARARARGARGTDGQAATDRAARPGPGDRPGHGRCHAVRHGLRLPGACRGPARPHPARARRRRRRRAGRGPRHPDRRAVGRAVGRARSRASRRSTRS